MADRERIPPTIEELAQIASHPVLVGLLEQIQASSSQEERLALSRKLVDRRYLSEQGVTLPETLRVSMRMFHEPDEPTPESAEVKAALEPYRLEALQSVTTMVTLPTDPGQRDDHYKDRPKPPPDLTHCVSVGGGPLVASACYSVGG